MVDWPHPIHHPTKKVEGYLLLLLPTYQLSWDIDSCPGTRSQWFSGFWTQIGTTPLTSPGLQLADGRQWDFSASTIMQPVPQNTYLHIYGSYWPYFPGEPWLIQGHVGLAPRWACPFSNVLYLLNSPFCPSHLFIILLFPQRRSMLILWLTGQPGRCVLSEVSECGQQLWIKSRSA